MTASILICTRNRSHSLRRTLESIAEVIVPEGVECELVVIDNGSTDDTASIVRHSAPENIPTRIVSEPEPGQAIARNTGIRAAEGSIIIFTDDDVVPYEDWLVRMLEPYTNSQVAAVQGRTFLVFDTPPPTWLSRVHRTFLAECEHGDNPIFPYEKHLIGANMSFRREVVSNIGAFNTLLGPGRSGFWDDSEFSARLLKAGYSQYYQPLARTRHMISSGRLTSAYFQKVAFLNGESSYLACKSKGAGETLRPFKDFLRQTLRYVKWEITHAIRRSRPTCSQEELFYLMSVGTLWARMQGTQRLKKRYSPAGAAA